MKRSIAVLLVVLTILSAVACAGGGASANKLIGTWVLDSGVGDEAEQSVALMKAFGAEMLIEFKDDGKGVLSTSYGGETDSDDFQYEFKDGNITIVGADSAGSIKLDGNNLIMESDGMQLIFKKK